MSDKELVTIDAAQWAKFDQLMVLLGNALWAINDQLKPLDNGLASLTEAVDAQTKEVTKWLAIQNETMSAGFELVAEAIANLQPLPQPQPKPQGVIMATFKVAADNADIQIGLVGSGFTDEDTPPNPTGAGDIDLSVESSNPDSVSATLSNQVLSDDGN